MVGTIELIGMGLGGHGIYGFHQTFIPAFNSTTARVERPDSEGRRIESSEVKFSTYEQKTNRVDILSIVHHLTCVFSASSNRLHPPLCVFKRVLKEGAKSHWLHLFDFSPL